MGTTVNDLQEELLLKIFLPQPMQSLVLSSDVCRLWDQIISSKYFIQTRQKTSSSNTNNKYLLLQGANSESTSLVDSENIIYHNIFGKKYECYGICDGLLCLSSPKDCLDSHSSIVLWNPIFRKVLPPLEIKDSQLTYLCFGYHDDDYKVIKVVRFPRMYYENVCIYSLSTDSWKILKINGHVSGAYNYDYKSWSRQYLKARFVNGAAYILKDSWKDDLRITYFDLCRKIFRETTLPGDFRHSYFQNSEFIMEEYRESLALIGCVYREDDLVVVMWVLRVSDSSFSWEEMSLIKEESNYKFQPMGFINKDELVIRSATCHEIPEYSFFLYNVKNESRRQFTTLETCAAMVQSSISVGGDARGFHKLNKFIKRIRSPTRQPTMKKVASTSNSYAALADSDDDLLDDASNGHSLGVDASNDHKTALVKRVPEEAQRF